MQGDCGFSIYWRDKYREMRNNDIVVAYLPQVKEKDIRIELHGDIFKISAQAKDEFGLQKYAKEILLPIYG